MSATEYRLPYPRYERRGQCNRCGWCCLQEDPPCDHLERMKDGRYRCMIYGEKERPLRCRLFPEMPPILNDKCGYAFWDRWEKRMLGVGEV